MEWQQLRVRHALAAVTAPCIASSGHAANGMSSEELDAAGVYRVGHDSCLALASITDTLADMRMTSIGGTLAGKYCVRDELVFQDARLNHVYRDLMGARSDATSTDMRTLQREWIRIVDAECEDPSAVAMAACRLDAVARRARALEQIRAVGVAHTPLEGEYRVAGECALRTQAGDYEDCLAWNALSLWRESKDTYRFKLSTATFATTQGGCNVEGRLRVVRHGAVVLLRGEGAGSRHCPVIFGVSATRIDLVEPTRQADCQDLCSFNASLYTWPFPRGLRQVSAVSDTAGQQAGISIQRSKSCNARWMKPASGDSLANGLRLLQESANACTSTHGAAQQGEGLTWSIPR